MQDEIITELIALSITGVAPAEPITIDCGTFDILPDDVALIGLYTDEGGEA